MFIQFGNQELKQPYAFSSTGTLVTNKEYATKLLELDELEIYTNDTPYKKEGLYITDYLADSFIEYSAWNGFKTYDDVLGQYSTTGNYLPVYYINGIIKTDYKSKYQHMFEYYKENFDYDYSDQIKLAKFANDMAMKYSIAYSFEEDFQMIHLYDFETHNYQLLHQATLNGANIENYLYIPLIVRASDYGLDVLENEIYLSYDVYNAIYNTNYTKTTHNEFIPHTITLDLYNNDDVSKNNLQQRKILTIKGLLDYKSVYIYTSDELLIDVRKLYGDPVALYFSSHVNIMEVIKTGIEQNFVPLVSNLYGLHSVSQNVQSFSNLFFIFLIIMTLGVTIAIIIYGLKKVADKIVQIGILKAMGIKLRDLGLIFTIQTIILSFVTIGIFIVGFYYSSEMINNIILDSMKGFNNLGAIGTVQIINFSVLRLTIYISLLIVISLVTVLSTFRVIKRIKPVQIIKAGR